MVARRTLFGGGVLMVPAIFALWAGIASARPDVLPVAGTVGSRLSIIGAGFGAAKGKANLVDATTHATTALKVVSWSEGEIIADVSKAPKSGFMEYAVSVTPKGEDYFRLDNTFTFSSLEAVIISTNTGSPGDSVTISGNYFGLKRGKVTLRCSNPKKPGAFLYKSCKVTSWEMDQSTGASTVIFLVPKVASGSYTVIMTSSMPDESYSTSFTVTAPL